MSEDFGDLFGDVSTPVAPITVKSFTLKLDGLDEALSFDERASVAETGGVIQQASIALARELPRLLTLLSSSTMSSSAPTMIELGCGAGVVGIVAAALTQQQNAVVLTDGDGSALSLARDNASESF